MREPLGDSQILEPSVWGKSSEDNLANWEDEFPQVREGDAVLFPSDIKIATMTSETQRALQEQLRLNAMRLKWYWDVTQVIINYFRSRHILTGSSSSGATPTEVDTFWQGKARQRKTQVYKYKGKGKTRNGKRKGV